MFVCSRGSSDIKKHYLESFLTCCDIFFLRGIGKQILKFSYLALLGMTTLYLASASFINLTYYKVVRLAVVLFLEEESLC